MNWTKEKKSPRHIYQIKEKERKKKLQFFFRFLSPTSFFPLKININRRFFFIYLLIHVSLILLSHLSIYFVIARTVKHPEIKWRRRFIFPPKYWGFGKHKRRNYPNFLELLYSGAVFFSYLLWYNKMKLRDTTGLGKDIIMTNIFWYISFFFLKFPSRLNIKALIRIRGWIIISAICFVMSLIDEIRDFFFSHSYQ